MVRYYCDASCGKRLEAKDIQESQELAGEFVKKSPEMARAIQNGQMTDVFCEEHRKLAKRYWADKYSKLLELDQVWRGTIQNHAKDFFGRLREVNANPRTA